MAQQSSKMVTANVTATTTAETAALTSDPISTPREGTAISISGEVNLTTGAAATDVTIRCRRGTGVAGAQVGESKVHRVGASLSAELAFGFVDFPGDVAQQVYTITIQQTAATGDATVNNGYVTIGTNLP